ncbi:MAG TPA: hypothetical protein VMB91_07325 [Solirubrobacteraceae bacterium]|nr:hypothetical protein [Solirubrobacteraceae bacterium]
MSGPPAVKNPRPTAPLAAAALLLLCAVVLVACGGSKSSTTTSVAANPATTSTGAGAGSSSGTTGATSSRTAGPAQPKRTGAGHSSTTSGAATSSGKSPTGGVPPAPTSPEASGVRRCLERNGIKSRSSGKAPTRAQLNAALAHCATPLKSARRGPRTSAVRRRLLAQPSYRQALVRFTSCMRTHGVPDFPEANTSGKGPLYPSSAVKPTPQLREAQKACIGELRVRPSG